MSSSNQNWPSVANDDRRALRIGIAGCGAIANRHARAAVAVPDVVFAACCDPRTEVAAAWADEHGVEQAYPDLETMLQEAELDAILLATWPSQHHEQILMCLERGARAVLCEKALTLTAKEALDVLDASREANALVTEAFVYRHHPAIRLLEQLVAGGGVGPVDEVRAAFSAFDPEDESGDDPVRNWRRRPECGGGVPYDFACYCVNACHHLAGSSPVRAFAVGGKSARYGTTDRLFGIIEYRNGSVGMVESSKRSDFDQALRVSGARGHVALATSWTIDGPTEVVVSRSESWGMVATQRLPVPSADAFALQLADFAAAVRGEAPPRVPLDESIINTITLDALVTSAAEHAAIDVRLPDRVLNGVVA